MKAKVLLFAKKNISSVGIELGEHSIKMVETQEVGGRIKLLSYGILAIPANEEARAERDASVISGLVKQLLDRCVYPSPRVYFSIAGPLVSLQRLTLPPMPEKEILAAIAWEGKKHFHFSLNESSIAWLKIDQFSSENTKIDLLVAAVLEQFLNQELSIFQKIGIKPAGINLGSFAIQDALQASDIQHHDKTLAFLDIRPTATTITILKNGKLQFARGIVIGGNDFTRALMEPFMFEGKQFALTFGEAEEIKKSYGIPMGRSQGLTPQGIPLSRIMFMVRPVLEKLITEALRSFDFYKVQTKDKQIDKVFLCGGTAGMKNLPEFLSSGLGIEANVFEPFVNIIVPPAVEKIEFPSMISIDEHFVGNKHRLALALGLSIGRCREINLLPQQPGVLESVRLRKWIPLLALILFFFSLFTFYARLAKSQESYQKQILKQKALLASQNFLMDEMMRFKQKREKLKEALLRFPDVSFEQPPFFAILTMLTQIFPDNVALVSITLQKGRSASGGASQEPEPMNLKLEGIAKGEDFEVFKVMTNITEALNRSPFFHKVFLASSEKVTDADAVRFVLECPLDPLSFVNYGG